MEKTLGTLVLRNARRLRINLKVILDQPQLSCQFSIDLWPVAPGSEIMSSLTLLKYILTLNPWNQYGFSNHPPQQAGHHIGSIGTIEYSYSSMYFFILKAT